MENKVKQCKHNVKLAFNNDEIISYCDKCGKILDRYVKVQMAQYPYYTYTTATSTPVVTCNGKISGGNSVTLTSGDNSATLTSGDRKATLRW